MLARQISYFSIIVLLFISCKSNKTAKDPYLKPAIVTFVDSTAAAKAIITDTKDGFFDQVSVVEMGIQMKKYFKNEDRSQVLNQYKSFLSTQVSPWKQDERLQLTEIFNVVKALCDTLSPRLFPAGMRLIKIKTGPLGDHVYYTRERDILIPENIFPIDDPARQIPVMIHEVFHVLSRYDETLRKDLYRLIGFSKSPKPVRLNDHLSRRLLTNPDGVSYQYVMELPKDGGTIQAVPLITSKYDGYRSSTNAFFDYLNFDLYELVDKGEYLEASTTSNGQTTIPLKSTPMFFSKIKDNTQYIIHPDEIMADNFMLGLQAYSKGDFKKFSKEGKELIDQLMDRLKIL
ncbi:MAG: hypothetical protein WBO36_13240 [Saprospiraceae bacterium]